MISAPPETGLSAIALRMLLISPASCTAYLVLPDAVGPSTHIRSISLEMYLHTSSSAFIVSAGGSWAMGGIGVNVLLVIAMQR